MGAAAAGAIEVTRGAPTATTLTVGRLRVSCASFPPSFGIASHYHEAACLSVIVDGGFRQHFPGRVYECPPGGLLVKPAGERHVDRWGDVPTRHLIIEPLALGPDSGPLERVFDRVSFRLDPRAIPLARDIYREVSRSDDLAPVAIEALASELVVLAGRSGVSARRESRPPAWLLRARDQLSQPRQRSSIAEVARDAGVEPGRLAREFRRHFGSSPGEYIRGLRLARARGDLEGTDRPIAAVAYRNGYADQSHLTREIKRATGLTPAVYRRAFRPEA